MVATESQTGKSPDIKNGNGVVVQNGHASSDVNGHDTSPFPLIELTENSGLPEVTAWFEEVLNKSGVSQETSTNGINNKVEEEGKPQVVVGVNYKHVEIAGERIDIDSAVFSATLELVATHPVDRIPAKEAVEIARKKTGLKISQGLAVALAGINPKLRHLIDQQGWSRSSTIGANQEYGWQIEGQNGVLQSNPDQEIVVLPAPLVEPPGPEKPPSENLSDLRKGLLIGRLRRTLAATQDAGLTLEDFQSAAELESSEFNVALAHSTEIAMVSIDGETRFMLAAIAAEKGLLVIDADTPPLQEATAGQTIETSEEPETTTRVEDEGLSTNESPGEVAKPDTTLVALAPAYVAASVAEPLATIEASTAPLTERPKTNVVVGTDYDVIIFRSRRFPVENATLRAILPELVIQGRQIRTGRLADVAKRAGVPHTQKDIALAFRSLPFELREELFAMQGEGATKSWGIKTEAKNWMLESERITTTVTDADPLAGAAKFPVAAGAVIFATDTPPSVVIPTEAKGEIADSGETKPVAILGRDGTFLIVDGKRINVTDIYLQKTLIHLSDHLETGEKSGKIIDLIRAIKHSWVDLTPLFAKLPKGIITRTGQGPGSRRSLNNEYSWAQSINDAYFLEKYPSNPPKEVVTPLVRNYSIKIGSSFLFRDKGVDPMSLIELQETTGIKDDELPAALASSHGMVTVEMDGKKGLMPYYFAIAHGVGILGPATLALELATTEVQAVETTEQLPSSENAVSTETGEETEYEITPDDVAAELAAFAEIDDKPVKALPPSKRPLPPDRRRHGAHGLPRARSPWRQVVPPPEPRLQAVIPKPAEPQITPEPPALAAIPDTAIIFSDISPERAFTRVKFALEVRARPEDPLPRETLLKNSGLNNDQLDVTIAQFLASGEYFAMEFSDGRKGYENKAQRETRIINEAMKKEEERKKKERKPRRKNKEWDPTDDLIRDAELSINPSLTYE